MKLQDIKIGSQLKIGLGILLVLVVILGATAWNQATSLWEETKGLYEHPHMIRRAVGDLRADVISIHRWMKDLALVDHETERLRIIQNIDLDEADGYRQFEILYDRFLGPRADIDEARKRFVQWKPIRDEAIQLIREGRGAEAAGRVRYNGFNAIQVEDILASVQKVSDFALNRAERFYADAQGKKDGLQTRLAIIVGVILLLSLGVAWFLLKSIREPLFELTSAADQYRRGNADARSRYASGNEFGELSTAFNKLAETVQLEMKSRENAARITDVMLREQDLRVFCQRLLTALVEHTGSQSGAIYLLNDRKTEFEHFESIGLGGQARASFSVAVREGEFGAALASRQIRRVADIPPDTRFAFSAVSGDLLPREILTIPILDGQEVEAMVSLASLRKYSPAASQLVNDIWSVLTARVHGVLAYRQIRVLAEKLEGQNRELEIQTRELAAQADELTEQNTELEMQKRQLDEVNRLKSRFLSNMSHELRTPLNSVIALSGVLSRRLSDAIPEEEYSYLEVIERNGKNLLALINDILDLSRVEAGREEIAPTSFSVRKLAAEVAAMIEPQVAEKGLALINSVDGDLPLITSDYQKCWHILQNLLGNAVKFTESGQVEISAEPAGDAVRIKVADTGIGIAEDQLPHIFDEFRQADDSMSRKYGGAGLGLAIARKYAVLLRGSLTAESVPGRGSTFTLTLPLSLGEPLQAGDSGAPAYPDETGVAPDGRGKTILLVEDSEPAVIQITDILAEQGYRVRVAKNGREAMEILRELRPDAMILDLMMPEVDGFQVLRNIRSDRKTASLPVLILTAKHVTREELAFLKGNHVYQLIQKGDVGKTELLTAIGKMVFPPKAKPAAPPRENRPAATVAKPVILIVEDNRDNLTTVKALLKDEADIIESVDGRAGVEQARRHRPDLILMDISLPVLNGIDSLRAIRDDEALKRIPVIAITASAMKGDRETILAHGFDAYIPKPIDRELLLNTIREKLDARERPQDTGD